MFNVQENFAKSRVCNELAFLYRGTIANSSVWNATSGTMSFCALFQLIELESSEIIVEE